jgi:hypothetical protein
MNRQNKALLVSLFHADIKRKYPEFPVNAYPEPKYTDKTANGLTKCIIDFITFSGGQAERINTMGRMLDNTKVVTDVLGNKKMIGSKKYIPTTGTKGSADISAVVPVNIHGVKVGLSFKIEVKLKKDKQSEYQKEYQKKIESTNGVYMIAKDFDSWYSDFMEILNQYK